VGTLRNIFRQAGWDWRQGMKYPVIIHKDPDSDYGVTIPDLPGCFSAGETIEETINMAQEAAECHIEGLLIDAEPIPAPSDIESHKHNPDFKDGIWALVEVDISKLSLKSRRINITMPERLINTVDQYARRCGSSRSSLLSQAVTEYMASHQ
jgi:predicted RNase H-like HicB family nuclease